MVYRLHGFIMSTINNSPSFLRVCMGTDDTKIDTADTKLQL